MEPELQQQYNTMINHVVNDSKEQAQAVLSNILAAKLATQLGTHNQQIMTLNRTSMDTAKAIVADATASI